MKVFQGVVVRVIDARTARIRVERAQPHRLYQKQMKRTKDYLVHLPGKPPAVGAKVTFRECRPISKRKKYIKI